ncbi:MAG: DUF3048 domain-containing protein, partial [Eubacteriales bacterium]|nr:DUF3048 domain-containing protein [Eubacteriales bacterium]
DNQNTEPTQTTEPTPEPTPTPVIYRHPLTGEILEEPYGSARPYAVMVNNIIYAQPQCGISQADIIYEVLAEGGITRMMAIFSDLSDVPSLGSIRSIRSYYVDIAMSYDAIPIHAGGSYMSYTYMDQLGVRNIDGCIGDYNAFYRDSSRMTYGVEHSLFTTGERLLSYMDGLSDLRREHDGEFDYGLRFTEDAVPEGETAKSVTVTFTGGKTTGFTYNEETGLYSASQYGGAYYDGNTFGTLTFRNVIVLYADTATIDGDGRLDVVLTGSGEGQYACGGSYTDISWSREGLYSPFSYEFADGSEFEISSGTTYICIVPTGSTVTFE